MQFRTLFVAILATVLLFVGTVKHSLAQCPDCPSKLPGVSTDVCDDKHAATSLNEACSVLLETGLAQLTQALRHLVSVAVTGPGDEQTLAAVETVTRRLSECLASCRGDKVTEKVPDLESAHLALIEILRAAHDVEEASRYIEYMQKIVTRAAPPRKGDLLLVEFLTRLRDRTFTELMARVDRLRSEDTLATIYKKRNPGMLTSVSGFELLDAITFYRGRLYAADAEKRIIEIYTFEPPKAGGKQPFVPVHAGRIDAMADGKGETQGILFDDTGHLLVVDEGGKTVKVLREEQEKFVTVDAFDFPEGLFHRPRGIAIGESGTIYISDGKKKRIHLFDDSYQYKQKTIDVFPDMYTQIECLLPLTGGEFLITNEYGHTIGRFTDDGTALGEFGRLYFSGQPEGIVRLPVPVNGRPAFMVVDELLSELEIFSLETREHLKTIRLGTGDGPFNLKSPDGLAHGVIDGTSYLFISDQGNGRVAIFNLMKLLKLADLSFTLDDELLGILNDVFDFIAARKFKLGPLKEVSALRAALVNRMGRYVEANPYSRAVFDREIKHVGLSTGIDVEDQPFVTEQ
ncbi:MAG: hypothetical protein QGH40_06450, partial [bacterium]|nr:hypothetical protein [bacterium]